MCVRGMKGNDFRKLRTWFSVILSRVDTFVELAIGEADEPLALRLALNVIKCGLYSQDLEVVEGCSRFFSKLS